MPTRIKTNLHQFVLPHVKFPPIRAIIALLAPIFLTITVSDKVFAAESAPGTKKAAPVATTPSLLPIQPKARPAKAKATSTATTKAPVPMPLKKQLPAVSAPSLDLRNKAERELSLDPWQKRIKAKVQPAPPLQVENLPTPRSIVPPTYTEAAITFTSLSPQGRAEVIGNQQYDLGQVEALPIVSAQIQHWFYRDNEKLQHIGYILGTGIGDKAVNLQLGSGYTISQVEILYMKLLAGLSLEKTIYDDRLHFGLSGLVVEELWQQNTAGSESRWSRWNPSIALSLQGKLQLNKHWYGLAEAHNQWPLGEHRVQTSQERLLLGLGYYL